ncbi:MAG: ATP synthase F1 subunit gamma [Clostridium sp.]|nr:ATP synthase F1 subunit gamma [Bacteroides sp.]MCM1199523.1 ATP synthase F1 subunit gamma [Clostridium sp.]
MASLKEIKNRINSVNGTLKITSAMKLVASAKLHKAQNAIGNLVPYETGMHNILDDLLSVCPAEGKWSVYSEDRPVRKAAVVAIASNSSLCGAFNSNAVKKLEEAIGMLRKSGLEEQDIKVYALGRKIADSLKKSGYSNMEERSELSGKPGYAGAAELAEELTAMFLNGKVDRIYLVYNHYLSTASQKPVCRTYLPLLAEELAGASSEGFAGVAGNMATDGVSDKVISVSDSMVDKETDVGPESRPNVSERLSNRTADTLSDRSTDSLSSGFKDYIIEPDIESLMEELLPKVLKLKIYTVMLDANAAEHAARTVAMQTATDNGNQLLQELSLQYNKRRQQAITDELLDIVGGSMA